MKSVIASLIAVAGMSVAAHGQSAVMKMLVSTDGVNFSSNVSVTPGQHVDVLVTATYTGDIVNDGIIGFGSANFQPVVTNWRAGNGFEVGAGSSGNQVGGMINPQASAVIAGSASNPYTTQTVHSATINSQLRDNGTPFVPSSPYAASSYGRVYPMGRTALSGANAITGFVQTIPAQTDQTGQAWAAGTYLRIAQANVPDWFNAATNNSGGSGINVAQLTRNGRAVDTVLGDGHHTVDPDFWGSQTFIWKNNTTPTLPAVNSWPSTGLWDQANGHHERLVDVQLYRFGLDIGTGAGYQAGDTLSVMAPLAGQQLSGDGLSRYMGYFLSDGASSPDVPIAFGTDPTANSSVQNGLITIVPSPASLALMGLGGLVVGRRRR
jgi:hypothetical protein